MSKSGLDRPIRHMEAPKLSEYNFNVDVAAIVSAIIRIKDTKWARPLQSDPAQREPNRIFRVLNGFNMACKTTKREITLPVNTARIIQEAKFYVIEGYMRYNALFERPWIHSMMAVPSTLHQMLKFPTPGGIKTIYGEQPAANEIFAIDEWFRYPHFLHQRIQVRSPREVPTSNHRSRPRPRPNRRSRGQMRMTTMEFPDPS
uniref:Uncharacterized protein n=1 Tax=Nicotiana tabacum TaxID=4097 RepID=A0A1S4D166_TOBAC|nr:PREDICTED: uncharacterized protein LOC107824887 [Nicotiana tabacum]